MVTPKSNQRHDREHIWEGGNGERMLAFTRRRVASSLCFFEAEMKICFRSLKGCCVES